MAEISDFQRYVLPFVNGAPLPAIDDAVLDACIDFCTRTRVLRETLDPMTLTASTAEYEIDPPDGNSQVVAVIEAWLPEGRLHAFNRPELAVAYPAGWADLTVSATADVDGYYCRLPGLIRLIPKVSATLTRVLTVEVAYCPTRKATRVDDVLFDTYAEVIAAGALSRLHQHPGAKYADPTRVAAYTMAFEKAIATMADDSDHGFSSQPLRTAMDDFR